jgi:hypothetical protein
MIHKKFYFSVIGQPLTPLAPVESTPHPLLVMPEIAPYFAPQSNDVDMIDKDNIWMKLLTHSNAIFRSVVNYCLTRLAHFGNSSNHFTYEHIIIKDHCLTTKNKSLKNKIKIKTKKRRECRYSD